ncbi:MAG TPA: hypothetical protein PLL88_09720 [Anaerolineaceae bacterium]|nr:hypothetical protein [Anaerolineaceae bacterium]
MDACRMEPGEQDEQVPLLTACGNNREKKKLDDAPFLTIIRFANFTKWKLVRNNSQRELYKYSFLCDLPED